MAVNSTNHPEALAEPRPRVRVLARRLPLILLRAPGRFEAARDKLLGRLRQLRLPFSLLTLRILAVNVLPLAILIGGLMYLDVYRQSLIDAEIAKLSTNGAIFAGALGEGAVRGATAGTPWIDPERSRVLVRRLVEPTNTRARVFVATGDLVADSRTLQGLRSSVKIEELPPPPTGSPVGNAIVDLYDSFAGLFARGSEFPRYWESSTPHAADYGEVVQALAGDRSSAVRIDERDILVISVAVPIQRYKKVVGALLLSSAGGEIEQNLREVRLRSLQVFAVVLAITILMSLYLARTIASPVMRLARAAEHVRRGLRRDTEIPDFSARQDEIGDLSAVLREMTDALWRRMDAIERFAADVTHEIKNPLSSLRSAVETASRMDDPERQRELMAIILQDVERLDRLISDISYASRLDSQISRREWSNVDVAQLLSTLVGVHEATCAAAEPGKTKHIRLTVPPNTPLLVRGNEDQLVQVFRNVFANGLSFTPDGSTISVEARAEGEEIVITIDDQGPGIPETNLESIFERFYTARPAGEKFGTHSGLGLSISRQIIEAHGGSIRASNRPRVGGKPAGARFSIRLPQR
ncbi:MAG: stimulus-sensing domain-containing protein [Alphaproteobacteria bacterium]|nr:stimulus-sensing domain-containing protein [Alphaproteobacteria bacterium]